MLKERGVASAYSSNSEPKRARSSGRESQKNVKDPQKMAKLNEQPEEEKEEETLELYLHPPNWVVTKNERGDKVIDLTRSSPPPPRQSLPFEKKYKVFKDERGATVVDLSSTPTSSKQQQQTKQQSPPLGQNDLTGLSVLPITNTQSSTTESDEKPIISTAFGDDDDEQSTSIPNLDEQAALLLTKIMRKQEVQDKQEDDKSNLRNILTTQQAIERCWEYSDVTKLCLSCKSSEAWQYFTKRLGCGSYGCTYGTPSQKTSILNTPFALTKNERSRLGFDPDKCILKIAFYNRLGNTKPEKKQRAVEKQKLEADRISEKKWFENFTQEVYFASIMGRAKIGPAVYNDNQYISLDCVTNPTKDTKKTSQTHQYVVIGYVVQRLVITIIRFLEIVSEYETIVVQSRNLDELKQNGVKFQETQFDDGDLTVMMNLEDYELATMISYFRMTANERIKIVFNVLRQAARKLRQMHGMGHLHMDQRVHLANAMIDENFQSYLIDFGMSINQTKESLIKHYELMKDESIKRGYPFINTMNDRLATITSILSGIKKSLGLRGDVSDPLEKYKYALDNFLQSTEWNRLDRRTLPVWSLDPKTEMDHEMLMFTLTVWTEPQFKYFLNTSSKFLNYYGCNKESAIRAVLGFGDGIWPNITDVSPPTIGDDTNIRNLHIPSFIPDLLKIEQKVWLFNPKDNSKRDILV